MLGIKENLHEVRRRIAEAASRAGRNSNDITLIAVSKTFQATAIVAAYEVGVRDFGENRVEEAAQKIPQLSSGDTSKDPIKWHLVGHLQSRKVKDAVLLFDYIHSVDSVELAERIAGRAAELNRTISVLLEVNTSGEPSKYGFPIQARQDFFDAANKIIALQPLNVIGLMTVAPIVQQPDEARPYFISLRILRDELQAQHPRHPLPHLSMGMTGDFEAAITEGATLVRIGRAIFGERR